MEINEVEKLTRLTFGTASGSNDQSLPMLADLHLDSDDESQTQVAGKQQYSLLISDRRNVWNSMNEAASFNDHLKITGTSTLKGSLIYSR